jgi:hypothetical protein
MEMNRYVSTGRLSRASDILVDTHVFHLESCQFFYTHTPPHPRPLDEGMTNGLSIFAYLVFGPGRVVTVGKTRPTRITAWRGPGARLIGQDEDSKEEA